MDERTKPYVGYRYPAEIISHAVWLYFRFTLSFREVEEILASSGVIVSYEAIRQWTLKFGQDYANALCRRQPQRGDKWHLDEVVLTMKGRYHSLWRAVDPDDYTLGILVQSRCGRHAAKRFFRKLLKGLRSAPRVIITDKLKSYAAAKWEILPGIEHRQPRGSIIEPSYRINPPGNKNGRCDDSTHQARHNDSCQSTARSAISFAFAIGIRRRPAIA